MELGGLFEVEGADEAFGGFRRNVVELTGLDAAAIAGVADAIADVDGGAFPGEVVADLCHTFPTIRALKLHRDD